MADVTTGSLCLGGQIERSKIPALIAALQLDLGPHFTFEALVSTIGTANAPFALIDDIAINYREFRCLPELMELGLTFMATHGRGHEFQAATTYYSPQLGTLRTIEEIDGDAFVPLYDLQTALAAGKSLADVIAATTAPFIVPPALEVIDDVRDIAPSAAAAVAAAESLIGAHG